MPGPQQLGDAVSNIVSGMFTSGAGKYMIYVTYFVYAALILGLLALGYYWIMYKYKLTIFEGTLIKKEGFEDKFITRTIKSDRAMAFKKKGIPKWKLLFHWKTIGPIDFKYIQPGNKVFLFRTGPDTFNPTNVSISPSNPHANFTVDPFDNAFLNLGVQSDAREYLKDDAVKKAQIWMFISGLIILIAIVVAGWLILKYSAGAVEHIDLVATAVNNLQAGAPR